MEATEHKAPNYIAVWAALAVLTVVEVAVVYLHLPRRLMVISLVFLALWKAMLVALYFMHLRFEPKRLLYVVLAPLPLAVILVVGVMHGFRGP
ncbi:MAG TPA: cytochrome C oxidase subunit IV family protein [Gemmatimonadales bacterium]|jgi:cytochrome c oxidase subunit 4|nr:cytochrome C oxidase subunit IV family protein [Gemmatimonadales bacterium]